ncbi:MAG: membrane protein insertion efficiency factor YidD [Mycoplasmatales bacterium]
MQIIKKLFKIIKLVIRKIFQKILKALIYFYKYVISPHTLRSCRYTPSCSDYSIEAIEKYGPIKGGYLALKRISSCHPWGKDGYDPVP